MDGRRTKRRYAHELFPHPDEDQTRRLESDVSYLYARAIGFEVSGTNWYNAEPQAVGARTMQLLAAREIALVADALAQGLTGQEAWAWAQYRASDETGEIVGERAHHYGVDWLAIKPYPCGAEPEHHNHYGVPDSRGMRILTRVDGKESECLECTEPEVATEGGA